MLVTAPENTGLSPRFAPPLSHDATAPTQPLPAVVGKDLAATALPGRCARHIAQDGHAAIAGTQP